MWGGPRYWLPRCLGLLVTVAAIADSKISFQGDLGYVA